MYRLRKTRKARTLVLHIGTEKTGSSSIQHTLARNRKLLRARGVLYPESVGPRRGSQWGFVACSRSAPAADDIDHALGIADGNSLDSYRECLRRTLQRQLGRGSLPESVVVSSEHLHSRVTDSSGVGRLAEFLSQFAEGVRVVMYLRRQDRVALALHMTHVKSGAGDCPVFPDTAAGFWADYFDYESLYARWSTVFGADRVTVRIFDDVALGGGDIVADFLGTIGVDPLGLSPSLDRNPSLSPDGYALIQHVNSLESCGRVALAPGVRARLVRGLEAVAAGRHYPATRREAEEFESRFAAGNARLLGQLFDRGRLSLFDRDFSEYPQEPIAPRADADTRMVLLLKALGEG